MAGHSYRFGIEEEYFIADAETRGTPRRTVKPFHVEAAERLPEIGRELLQCQIEVCTPPSTGFDEAREVLLRQRRALSDLGREHGLIVFAAGTHPVADWARQLPTKADRYRSILRDVGLAGRRSLICGMHVHVEVADPHHRVDLMNRLLPFQPFLFAFSVSSPFWQGKPTGLSAYRLSAFGELPRTGLPDLIATEEEYERYVRIMTEAGSIVDASYLWYSLRPSKKFPTLELRIADSCTRLDDALVIAALYRCLVRLVERRPDVNRGLTGVSRALAQENLWRAQRNGIEAELIDEKAEQAYPFAEYLDRVLSLIDEDAKALGCEGVVADARRIIKEGTSADRQIALFEAARGEETSNRHALDSVVDWLAETSRSG